MASRPRQYVSYVLPLTNAPAGHRLGVNGLAADFEQSLLYSAGRDGVIHSWRLPEECRKAGANGPTNGSSDDARASAMTSYVESVQAHTHWINDLVTAENHHSLISASSDASVKLWRPHALDRLPPQVIGYHNDYVKCLASPNQTSPWVAAGGLDRLLRLWDVSGQGEKLRVSVEEEGSPGKGSIYALAATRSLIACGGPDCVVKLLDPRSGRRVNRFIGHTDNIRSILLSEDGDSLVTASSDKTIKVWSVTAGRCIYNLAIHTDSVWSLYSDCPDLGTVYSGDRSGLVAKTEAHNASALDQSMSVGLFRENEGINKVLGSGDHVWAATAGSSINRWEDVDLSSGIQIPESLKNQRFSNHSRSRFSMSSQVSIPQSLMTRQPGKIPLNSLLKIPIIPGIPQFDARDRECGSIQHHLNSRKVSLSLIETEIGPFCSLRSVPEETIEGQHGLIKHFPLNDRRHVLTVDSAGEVVLWDILECRPKQYFGKRHVDEAMQEINKMESLAQWCTIDTRTGTLTCTLEESRCFEAEMYADELTHHDRNEFKDDQRINLGKWVLRYLFADLVNEEIRRDEEYRQSLLQSHQSTNNDMPQSRPHHISLPQTSAQEIVVRQRRESASTPRAGVSNSRQPLTPGLSISVATPLAGSAASPQAAHKAAPAVSPSDHKAEKTSSQTTHASTDQALDYFSNQSAPTSKEGSENKPSDKSSSSSSDGQGEESSVSAAEDGEKGQDSDKTKSLGKRLRSTFAPKRLGKVTSSSDTQKPTLSEKGDSAEGSSTEESSDAVKIEQDNPDNSLLGVIQKIRRQYFQQLEEGGTGAIKTLITPSLPSETPVLKVPSLTSIIIQEEQPDSGGVIDVFECTANEVRNNLDLLESIAPAWLGDVLLRNEIPQKDVPKVTFMLRPYKNLLPHVTERDGQERLNANRMLRAKKVLGYVAERLESTKMDRGEADARPEDYLELHCHEQVVPPNMTLATIRNHMWRSSTPEIVLFYKASGQSSESTSEISSSSQV